MGRQASEYWEKAEHLEGLLSKEAAKRWLSYPCWTIGEACNLLAGTEPDERFGNQVRGSTQTRIFEVLRTCIIDASPHREENKVFTFCGYKKKLHGAFGSHVDLLRLEYPVCAYFAFAIQELYPNEKLGFDLPAIGLFHDLDKESGSEDKPEFLDNDFLALWTPILDEAQKTMKPLPFDLRAQAQVGEYEGKESQSSTVESVSALIFDKANPRYRAELHAAVELWTSFESKPVPKGLSPMQEIKIRLADWEVENNCELLDSERARIRVMVNWDKDGNKQRPKAK